MFAQLDNTAPYDKNIGRIKSVTTVKKRVILPTTARSLKRLGRDIWTTTIDPWRAPLTVYESLKRI